MRQASATPLHDVPPWVPASIEPVYTRDELAARTAWDEISMRLLAYARAKVWRHGSAAYRYALQPADLVQEAVAAWLEGRRTFEAGTEKAFFGFLCGVVDSLLSHDKEKTVRRGWQCPIAQDGGDETTGDEMTEGRIRAGGDFEHELLFRDDLQRFIDSLEPELAAYAAFVAEDPSLSAEERALSLDLTVGDVRNLDRRLHRRGREWMKR